MCWTGGGLGRGGPLQPEIEIPPGRHEVLEGIPAKSQKTKNPGDGRIRHRGFLISKEWRGNYPPSYPPTRCTRSNSAMAFTWFMVALNSERRADVRASWTCTTS